MHMKYADEHYKFSILAWTNAKERNVGIDLEEKYFLTSYSENIQATLEIFFHLSSVL